MILFRKDFALRPVNGSEVKIKKNQPRLVNLSTGEYLVLQGLPLELSYSPESQVATIASVGRNNPLYQPTSSEDILKLNISYYSTEELKRDVIKNCKWVESLTKNDGFMKGHPEVMLFWGELYQKAKWLVISAPYTMRLFDRDNGMLPKLATQEVTLKRITETNLRHKEILSLDT